MNPNESDTRLTDHLFDELSDKESAELNALLEADLDLSQESADLSAVLGMLAADEPADIPERLDDDRRATILSAAAEPPAKKPWWPVLIPLAAAAAVVALGTFLTSPGKPRMHMAQADKATQTTAESAKPAAAQSPMPTLEMDLADAEESAPNDSSAEADFADADMAEKKPEETATLGKIVAAKTPPKSIRQTPPGTGSLQRVQLVDTIPAEATIPEPVAATSDLLAGAKNKKTKDEIVTLSANDIAADIQQTAVADVRQATALNEGAARRDAPRPTFSSNAPSIQAAAAGEIAPAAKPKLRAASAKRKRMQTPPQDVAAGGGELKLGSSAELEDLAMAADEAPVAIAEFAGTRALRSRSAKKGKALNLEKKTAAPQRAAAFAAAAAPAAAPASIVAPLIPTAAQIAQVTKLHAKGNKGPVVQRVQIGGQSLILAAIPSTAPLPKRNDPRILWLQRNPTGGFDLILLRPTDAQVLGLLPVAAP